MKKLLLLMLVFTGLTSCQSVKGDGNNLNRETQTETVIIIGEKK